MHFNSVLDHWEFDESRFPPDGKPIPVYRPAQGTVQDFGIAAADDGSIFDVMLIYTPAPRAAAAATRAMNVLIMVRRYPILV